MRNYFSVLLWVCKGTLVFGALVLFVVPMIVKSQEAENVLQEEFNLVSENIDEVEIDAVVSTSTLESQLTEETKVDEVSNESGEVLGESSSKTEEKSIVSYFVDFFEDIFGEDPAPIEESEQIVVEQEETLDINYDNGPVLGEGARESRSSPEFLNEEVSFLSLKDREVEDVILDSEAKHRCSSRVFSYKFEDENQISVKLDLLNGGRGGFLKIGSLPYGIDATFSDNSQYEIYVDKKIKKLDLLFSKESGAQQGSFNITIIYKIDNDKESYNLCQINIIN